MTYNTCRFDKRKLFTEPWTAEIPISEEHNDKTKVPGYGLKLSTQFLHL